MRNTYDESDPSDPSEDTPTPVASQGRNAHTPNARMVRPPLSEGNANDQGECDKGWVSGSDMDLASQGKLNGKGRIKGNPAGKR